MNQRRLRIPNQFLQSAAVFVVTFVAVFVAWYLLWPYQQKAATALGGAALFALFCAAGSWMRSHDDQWESAHLRTRPILSFKRITEERRERREARSSPDVSGAGSEREVSRAEKAASKAEKKAAKKAEKAEKKARPVVGYEELANLKGKEGAGVALPGEHDAGISSENGGQSQS